MRRYSTWALVYSLISLIAYISYIATDLTSALGLAVLSAIWSAEYSIIAKIIERKPKGSD